MAAVKNPTQLDFILVNGEFEVHKHGCRDLVRAIKNKVTDYTEPGIINIDAGDSYVDVVRFLYEDQIREAYDYAADPDQDNAVFVPGQPADGDTPEAPEYYLPSLAWLTEQSYLSSSHFNPCIRQWVSVTTQACDGAGKEWKSAEGLKNANALECPECYTTAGELGLTPRKRNGKWRPLVPQHEVEVEEVREPTAPAPKTDTRNGNSKADAKRLLATHVALAIAELTSRIVDTNLADTTPETAEFRAILASFSNDEIRSIASTWVHHIPADRERWVAAGLPKPDRSDWR